MSAASSKLSPDTHALLAQDALNNRPCVRLVKLPLMPSDAECLDFGTGDGGPDDEPPSKRKKIVPYKLKESDKKMVYDSGTIIYTEEFKRSVWDYLLTHSLADGELRYPEISHSVLYKWRRKALEEKGAFVPQRNVESRKSLLADLKKDRDADHDKDRRHSEPPKIPKLKISLKMTQREEPRPRLIPALSDDLSVEKKVKVVIFALQNSTQKAAEHFNLRAGEVHSYMSQNVIRRMALDRIRSKVTKGSKGETKTREEMEEIVNLARRTNVERAARQYGVREGQVLNWMKSGIPLTTPAIQFYGTNGTSNGSSDSKANEFSIDFRMRVLDLARKQSLSRACKVFQLQPSLVQDWMEQFFPKEEVQKVVNHDDDELSLKGERHEVLISSSINADELEKMLYDRLQQPSSRIRALDAGEIQMDRIVSILKVALTAGSKEASAKFNIPRTTIATWIARNALDDLVRGVNKAASAGQPVTNGSILTPLRSARETRAMFRNSAQMGTDSPSPSVERSLSPVSIPLANGDEMELDELMDSNNNRPLGCPSAMNGHGDHQAAVKALENGPDATLIRFNAKQLEQARELGITMKCLSRWLECRPHFIKTHKGKLLAANGDTLKEMLIYRLETVEHAQREGRVYAASVSRATLGELHEWTNRRESYLRVLVGAPSDSVSTLAVVDTVADLQFDNAEKERAQKIAARLGVDLNLMNQFLQQLFADGS